jgi:hypothetical protein
MTQRVLGPAGPQRRKRLRLLIPVVLLALAVPAIVWASAVPQPTGAPNDPTFEFDGNLLTESAQPGTLDWALGAAGSGSPVITNATRNADGSCSGTSTDPANFTLGFPGVVGQGLLVCDGTISKQTPNDANAFVQGQHEDEGENPINWVIKPASSPKKTDLSEIYFYGKVFDSPFDANAAADNLIFIFDAGRLDTNGDFHVDFELNQAKQNDCGDSDQFTFCQPRTVNDIIVSYDSVGGTTPPVATIFIWKTSLAPGESCESSQGTITSPTLGGCYVLLPSPQAVNGYAAAAGVFNTTEIDAAPWKAVVCDPTSVESSQQCTIRSKIPAGGNMEGYIDVSGFIQNFDLCPGFGQVSAKSRSSSGINASLQDTSGALGVNASVCRSLLIRKEAKNASTPATNDLLGGAAFTITPSPLTGTGSLLVTDGSAPDANATPGLICIDNVINIAGSYSIVETTAPANYAKDTSTKTVAASALPLATCASRSASPTPDVTPFVNVPLSKIQVIFTSSAGTGVTQAVITCKDENGNTLTFDAGSTDNVNESYSGLVPNTDATKNYDCTINIDP